MSTTCVFCTKVEIADRLVAQNDLAWAFPTNIPITPYHMLVVPKRCVARFENMTNEERLAVFDLAETIMQALRKIDEAQGFNCAWNQEKLAGQSVPHFHLHIIPRKEGDTGLLGYDPRSMLYRTGDRDPVSEDAIEEVSTQLRKAIL